jgi:hypothetical protein|tara:strand:- start:213 stop:557 length:345 start_codon:yes stop_codon:yes gene_type:complete
MSKDNKRKNRELPEYIDKSGDNLNHLLSLIPEVFKEGLGLGSPEDRCERLNINFLGLGLKLINRDGEDFYIIVMDTGDDDEVRRRLSEYGRRVNQYVEFQDEGITDGINKKYLQ